MSRRLRLESVRTLADSAERECSRTVADGHSRLAAEEQRLEQLRSYLREYAEMSSSGNGVFVDTVQMRRRFVAKIREAIEQQERLLTGLRARLDDDLQRWRDARSRALALERYDERLEEQASDRRARREQAALDEVGQRPHHGG